jgi:uncharacterized membrane protein YbhN (UPF0104 family)
LLTLHRDRNAGSLRSCFIPRPGRSASGEVWLALYALHHDISLRSAFILESIGMAVRTAGFARPGTLGVQEAAFLFAGGLVGLSPDLAIALSFMKRIREFLVVGSGSSFWGGKF